MKIHLRMSSVERHPFSSGCNVLISKVMNVTKLVANKTVQGKNKSNWGHYHETVKWIWPLDPPTIHCPCNEHGSIWLGIFLLNTLRPRQNGRHFPDDIFKWIFLRENVWISINISLKFVPRGPINNIPTSVQVMAWRRPGDKPLSEPMMVRLPMHICVTRPQWVNNLNLSIYFPPL